MGGTGAHVDPRDADPAVSHLVTTATDVQIPVGLPVLPGAVLSGRYVLSGAQPLNKGDTLDAFPLPARRVALLVADVVGSGFGAAIAVSEVKAILRDRLCSGESLLAVLGSAERYARAHPELCATTVCVAILGLDDGELEWATAGHPPPLWLGAGGESRFLRTPPSRPLGAGGHAVTHRTRLEVGEMVALYTDGLVSFSGETLAAGYDRLHRAATESVVEAPGEGSEANLGDAICDGILRHVLPDDGIGDDAALLIVTRSRLPIPFALRVAAVPENLSDIRHRVNRWLDGLGAGLLDHIGLGHAVVELAANVIEHAYVGAETVDPLVKIDARLENDGAVSVTVSDTGEWREQTSHGRGLMMASGLADTIRVNRSNQGTSVTLTQRLTRPVPLLEAVAEQAGETVVQDSVELRTRVEPGRFFATGPVDDLSIEVFHAGLSEATCAGTADAIVDLSGVTHLASPGVQALFELIGRSKGTGSTITLQAPRESPAGQILALVDLSVSA